MEETQTAVVERPVALSEPVVIVITNGPSVEEALEQAKAALDKGEAKIVRT